MELRSVGVQSQFSNSLLVGVLFLRIRFKPMDVNSVLLLIPLLRFFGLLDIFIIRVILSLEERLPLLLLLMLKKLPFDLSEHVFTLGVRVKIDLLLRLLRITWAPDNSKAFFTLVVVAIVGVLDQRVNV